MDVLAERTVGLIFAGGDVGFGTGKIDMSTPDGEDVQCAMQATIAAGGPRDFKKLDEKFDPDKNDLENQLLTMDVDILNHQNGISRHLFMGKLAVFEGTDSRYCWDDDKSTDDDAMALLVAQLAAGNTWYAGGVDNKVSVYLGTGLPLKHYKKHKDSYEKNIRGAYTVSFKSGPWEEVKSSLNILKCRVYPQVWGIYYNQTHDDNGNLINKHLLKGYVLVVDPGFRTFDYALFHDGQMVDAYCDSLDFGVAWALKQISNKLAQSGISMDEKELDHYLMAKNGICEMADGRVIDLKPYRDIAFKSLAKKWSEELHLVLQNVWSKIQCTVVGGGGGEGTFEMLSVPQKIKSDNPQFGNASGFLKATKGAVHKAMKNNG